MRSARVAALPDFDDAAHVVEALAIPVKGVLGKQGPGFKGPSGAGPARLAAKVWVPPCAGPALLNRSVLCAEVVAASGSDTTFNGQRFPAILEYIPYRKNDGTALRDSRRHKYLAAHGFVSFRVDLRGSGDSDGVLTDEYLQTPELDDACEVIEWLASRAWCNGKVGMFGKSWGAFNALQVAALQPAGLAAIIAVSGTCDRYNEDIHYIGGALSGEGNLPWASYMLGIDALPPDPLFLPTDASTLQQPSEHNATAPELSSPGEEQAAWMALWRARLERSPNMGVEWLRHQRRDAYWRHGSVCEDFSAIRVPVLAVGGWADGYVAFVLQLLRGLDPSVPCAGLLGQWAHQYPEEGSPGPPFPFAQDSVRWWRQWLLHPRPTTAGRQEGRADAAAAAAATWAAPSLDAAYYDMTPPRKHFVAGRSLRACLLDCRRLPIDPRRFDTDSTSGSQASGSTDALRGNHVETSNSGSARSGGSNRYEVVPTPTGGMGTMLSGFDHLSTVSDVGDIGEGGDGPLSVRSSMRVDRTEATPASHRWVCLSGDACIAVAATAARDASLPTVLELATRVVCGSPTLPLLHLRPLPSRQAGQHGEAELSSADRNNSSLLNQSGGPPGLASTTAGMWRPSTTSPAVPTCDGCPASTQVVPVAVCSAPSALAHSGAGMGLWWGFGEAGEPHGDQRADAAYGAAFDASAPLQADTPFLGVPHATLTVEVAAGVPNVLLCVRLCALDDATGNAVLLSFGVCNAAHRNSEGRQDRCDPLVPTTTGSSHGTGSTATGSALGRTPQGRLDQSQSLSLSTLLLPGAEGSAHRPVPVSTVTLHVTMRPMGVVVPHGWRLRVLVTQNMWPMVWPLPFARSQVRLLTGAGQCTVALPLLASFGGGVADVNFSPLESGPASPVATAVAPPAATVCRPNVRGQTVLGAEGTSTLDIDDVAAVALLASCQAEVSAPVQHTMLAADGSEHQRSVNFGTGEVTVTHDESDGATRFEHNGVVRGGNRRVIHRIRPGDPLSATTECLHNVWIRRDPGGGAGMEVGPSAVPQASPRWDVVVLTRTTQRCTRDLFIVTTDIVAYHRPQGRIGACEECSDATLAALPNERPFPKSLRCRCVREVYRRSTEDEITRDFV